MVGGPIPIDGWNPDLRFVVLRSQLLEGPILEIAASLKQLEVLEIEGDRFGGSIPANIGDLKSLVQLQLTGLKRASGSLPSSICQLSSLKKLSLRSSAIKGPIPADLGALDQLDFLLIEAPLSGTIPSSIGNLSRLESLQLQNTYLKGPFPRELFSLKALRELIIGNALGGGFELPPEIVNLSLLQFLSITSSGLIGTIPRELEKMESLSVLRLSSNFLIGTVPPLPASLDTLSLSSNRLHGTLETIFGRPKLTLSQNGLGLTFLDLSHNLLEGTLPDAALQNFGSLLDLSFNNLSGTLPQAVSISLSWSSIKLSHNRFHGTIPHQYSRIENLATLYVDHNQLTGNIDGWTWNPFRSVGQFDASFNLLSGQLPDLSTWWTLTILRLSNNRLSGTLPLLPSSILTLDLGHNPGISSPVSSVLGYPKLRNIDLSHNSMFGELSVAMLNSSFFELFLGSNQISGTIPDLVFSSLLRSLDLSNNRLFGTVPTLASFDTLASLSLANNSFTGQLNIQASQLTYLDISFNLFGFSISQLSSYIHLIAINAASNAITGKFGDLSPLTSLKSVDLSDASLDQPFDLYKAQSLFKRSLQQLYIRGNSGIPTIYSLSDSAGPWRTTQSQPSPSFPTLVECFTLTFDPSSSYKVFVFDENLFNYRQCDCMNGFYGIPPFTCYTCPPYSSCKANTLHVKQDHFIFSHTTQSTRDTNGNRLDIEMDPQTHNGALESLLETEDCIVSLAATESNCLGLNLTFEQYASTYDVLELFNSRSHEQCLPGSGGRLCSRCECDLSIHQSCFYKRGFKCSRCSTIFTLSQSIPLIVGIVMVIFTILTIIMTIVLRGRRQVRNKRWEDLPLSKRIWYRLVDTSKSGLISILVLFIQILVALTHWDAFLIRTLAQMMNGNIESIGLVCLFPSLLTNPLTSLALQLTLPLMLSALAAVSVGCGHLLSLWIDRRSSSLQSSSHFESSDFSDMDDSSSSSSTSSLLDSTRKHIENRVDYPALALVSSNTISILQFFYFGTSLTATEYFFSSVQSHTGLKYVQAYPWMLYDDAKSLRGLSIPWLIFVVIGFPITFLVFSWLIRHKPTSPNITSYVGSLFSRYRHRVFWWELVNVMKKLTIALLIRGISATNPMQVASITLSICIPLVLQTSVRPWKRYWENVMDVIGSVLLIASLVASETFTSRHAFSVLYLILTLDCLYILSIVGMVFRQLIMDRTEYQRLWDISFGYAQSLSEHSFSELGHPLRLSITSMNSISRDEAPLKQITPAWDEYEENLDLHSQ